MGKEIRVIKPYDYNGFEIRKFERYEDEKFGVGKIFTNNKGCKMKVIAKSKKRCCRIVEFESGYIAEATTYMIGVGKVRDKLSPYAYGVGVCDVINAKYHPLYDRWLGILKRCYSKEYEYYKYYGGKGVYVSNEWLKFSNFIADMEKKDNYNEMISTKNKYHIDKDIKSADNKCYSNETVSIVSAIDNNKEMNSRNKHVQENKKIKVIQFSKGMDILNEFDSMREASRKSGVYEGNISNCCNGKLRSAGGYIWKKKGNL